VPILNEAERHTHTHTHTRTHSHSTQSTCLCKVRKQSLASAAGAFSSRSAPFISATRSQHSAKLCHFRATVFRVTSFSRELKAEEAELAGRSYHSVLGFFLIPDISLAICKGRFLSAIGSWMNYESSRNFGAHMKENCAGGNKEILPVKKIATDSEDVGDCHE